MRRAEAILARPASARIVRQACGIAVRASPGLILLELAGCVGSRPPTVRCSFVACGEDTASLIKVTASAVGAAPGSITVQQSERQFGGAVMVWRAVAAGRSYDCREGRNVHAPARVHYVDCRVSAGAGPLKAFP